MMGEWSGLFLVAPFHPSSFSRKWGGCPKDGWGKQITTAPRHVVQAWRGVNDLPSFPYGDDVRESPKG
jgi:hypothetical protein